VGVGGVNAERWGYNGESPQQPMEPLGFNNDNMMGMGIEDSTFTWEMIGLGLEEPLPPQETIDELYVILIPLQYIWILRLISHSGTRFTLTKSIRLVQ
jgi:hypothetical protein